MLDDHEDLPEARAEQQSALRVAPTRGDHGRQRITTAEAGFYTTTTELLCLLLWERRVW